LRLRKYFENPGQELALHPVFSSMNQESAPVTGKTLARRLKGLLTKEKTDRLERSINESCEQIDD
jgi:hypothetical protein